VFVQWTGDIISAANPKSVVMDGDKELVANFIEIELQPPVIDVSQSCATDDGFVIDARGRPGSVFEIQVSTDLNNWSTIDVITVTEETQTWLAPLTPEVTQQYYRLLEVR